MRDFSYSKFILSLTFWVIFIATILLLKKSSNIPNRITTNIYEYENDDIVNLYLKRNYKDESLYADKNHTDIDSYQKYVHYEMNEKIDQDIFLIGDMKNSDIGILLFKDNSKNVYFEQIIFKESKPLIDDIFSSISFEEFDLSHNTENNFEYKLKQYFNSEVKSDSKYDIDFFNTHLKINHKEDYVIKPNAIISEKNIAPNNLEAKYLQKFNRIYDYAYIENYIKYLVKEIHKKGYSLDLYSFEFDYYQNNFEFEYDKISMKLSISNLTEDDILSDNFYQILKEKLVIHDAEYIE